MSDRPALLPGFEDILAALEGRFPGAVLAVEAARGECSVRVGPERLADILKFLKAEQGFAALQDMIGLDRGPAPPAGAGRFAVLYQIYRPADRRRLRLSVEADEANPLPSAVATWRSADWAEREIFDMFGLRFAGHPGLRRIYLDEEFDGHPLRKDFPLGGRSGGL
ncbi:MAG: NADH-quinone oxidoreductase subunit C [Candidatus Aminicenantes bacterium]|nr:NADH-quinone oxidoreductase subunit C [Candidatus Aminicenantes bacterium]